jgi:hypothetical protein
MACTQSLQFYPTPRPLAIELVKKIPIYPADEILEPSAGRGAIADAIREMHPTAHLSCIEIDPQNVNVLQSKGYHGWRMDFLKHRRKYDVIIANPPFCGYWQDTDHFRHAWELLKPGGRLAFIVHEFSAFPKFPSGKPRRFADWLDVIGACREKNPPLSFSRSTRPTNTGTAMVWATKPTRPLTSAFEGKPYSVQKEMQWISN